MSGRGGHGSFVPVAPAPLPFAGPGERLRRRDVPLDSPGLRWIPVSSPSVPARQQGSAAGPGTPGAGLREMAACCWGPPALRRAGFGSLWFPQGRRRPTASASSPSFEGHLLLLFFFFLLGQPPQPHAWPSGQARGVRDRVRFGAQRLSGALSPHLTSPHPRPSRRCIFSPFSSFLLQLVKYFFW